MMKWIIWMGLILQPGFSYGQSSLQGQKWTPLEIAYSLKRPPEAPFEVEMGCIMEKDGTSLRVPGFYNGGGEWIVRFCPPEAGEWTATSYASLPKLAGRKVDLSIANNDSSQKGGIEIDPDRPRHFRYQNGQPYYPLAFELDWLFALDYADPDLPKTRELIGHVAANGFNQVIMNVYAHDVRWPKDSALKAEHEYGGRMDMFPFGGNNDHPDHSSLDVAYFQHLDRVIELLAAHDIVAHLMIYVWNKEVNWPKAESAADSRYFDYVVKRYQGYPNLVWDISKEALAYGHDDIDYITRRIKRLRKLDAHQRLVTVHDYAYCKAFPEMVDIISIQAWASNLYDVMLEVRDRHPDKPIFNIEHGGYEMSPYAVFQGNYDDPLVCLARNYLCQFAGAYSTYYWQASSWNVIIHDPFSPEVNPHPKFVYYQHLQHFLKHWAFESLKPSSYYSSSGYCLTDEKDVFLYFVPAQNVGIDIKRLPQTDNLEVQWFDPQTGTYSPVESRPWSGYFRLHPPNPGSPSILIVQRK